MKSHLIEVTVAAAGTFAIVAALHNAPVMDLIYESAISGGNISAGATESLGNIAAIVTASAP